MARKKDIKKETEIAVKSGYSLLANIDVGAMITEELDGLDAGFERIKIPSGGSTVFEMPCVDSENPNGSDTEVMKEFSAVILYHHTLFAYYESEYNGGGNPPDCGSFDGVTGMGDPGGDCRRCPFNQFGSGKNGGKACKNRRRIYILREGEIFPLLLSLPTGSLKELTKYLKRLLSKGMKSNSVVTKFSLKKAVNSTGTTYSQAQFALDRILTDEERGYIEKLSEQIKAYSGNVGFEYDTADDMDETTTITVDPETGEIIEPLQ